MIEPSILTANCYFWKPSFTAPGRRRNEERHQSEVAAWFKSIGMTVEVSGTTVYACVGEIIACFSYSESCKNCYKSLDITRVGKRSNITLLRKLADPARRAGTLRSATMLKRKERAARVWEKLTTA